MASPGNDLPTVPTPLPLVRNTIGQVAEPWSRWFQQLRDKVNSGGGGGGSGGGGSGVALIQPINQAYHGFVVGQVVMRISGSYVLAKADVTTDAEALGIVSAVADINTFSLTTSGLVTGLSGLTDSTVYFLDPAAAGALTTVEPTTVGQVSKPLFVATGATFGIFNNWRGEILGTGTGGGGFINSAATTIAVGGITVGSTFPTTQTLQQMFDALLYPFQSPAFTSFSLAGVSANMEVGTSFGPGVTFDWATSYGSNVTANTIGLTDITLSATIASGLSNSGSSAQTLSGAVTRTSYGIHQFGISGQDIHSVTFNGVLTLSWEWMMYYGENALATVTAANILALANHNLATGYAGTYPMGAGGYSYICLADAVGGQINSVKDQTTGFSVPMAYTTPYTTVDGGGFSYTIVSVTNAQGVAANVRVYRSQISFGSAVTLVVT